MFPQLLGSQNDLGAAIAAAARFLAEGRSRAALCIIPGRTSIV